MMLEDRVYCYPGTDVLVNRLGVEGGDRLQAMERDLTMSRAAELDESRLPQGFGPERLKAIHGYLFQDVYDWAGEFRTIDIYKGYSAFCPACDIDAEAGKLFGRLERDGFLKGLDRDEFPRKMAYFMADLNQLHPFREGNGRTQREFASELARAAGWDLRLSDIPKNSLQGAMMTSYASTGPLERLLRANCTRVDGGHTMGERSVEGERARRRGVLGSIVTWATGLGKSRGSVMEAPRAHEVERGWEPVAEDDGPDFGL